MVMQRRYKVYNKIPRWVKPLEVSTKPDWLKDQNLSYDQLLDKKGKLLREEELDKKGISLEWWTKVQIKSKVKEDSKTGFYEKETV